MDDQAKPSNQEGEGNSNQSQQGEVSSRRPYDGLIGLVNIGNSCYMNASLQALSNCPPFCRYFIECFPSSQTSNRSISDVTHHPLSAALNQLFRKMWMSERNPGNLNPRTVSSNMRQRTFHGSTQQDAQEFLRSLLNQVHDEIAVPVYQNISTAVEDDMETMTTDHQGDNQRTIMEAHQQQETEPCTISIDSHSSTGSTGSSTKLMQLSLGGEGGGSNHSSSNTSSPSTTRALKISRKSSNSLPNTPLVSTSCHRTTEKPANSHSHVKSEKLFRKNLSNQHSGPTTTPASSDIDASYPPDGVDVEMQMMADIQEGKEVNSGESQPSWNLGDTIVVDKNSGKAYKHEHSHHNEGKEEEDGPKVAAMEERNERVKRSIITEVFEGEVESSVECLHCRNISSIKESFQDLSVPIPSRKDMMGINEPSENEKGSDGGLSISGQMCRAWKSVYFWARDMIVDPPTTLNDCFNAFFDPSDLTGDNRYFCEKCDSLQNSRKTTVITKLPEILCVHLKRFKYDTFFASKISRYILFPLKNLNMSKYLKHSTDSADKSEYVYDLVSMVTHYGGASGGHYVAFAMNHETGQWHEFNDSRVSRTSTNTVSDEEAYLLFYSRKPVNKIPKIKIADIIPPPEVEIPSQDTAYISRHWLMLRNLCVDPGPLLEYHYTCEHGGVLPGREQYAEMLALPIQKSIWLDLKEQYGCGTPLERKLTCTKCQDYLSELKDRRNKEKEEANKIQTSSKGKPNSYVLATFWLKQWQSFINCATLEVDPPGPIGNSRLLFAGKDGTINFCTKSQYIIIAYPVWRYLFDIYGGGPHITTIPPDEEDIVEV